MLQFERERPLVLIVEDEFLIRMDAVDMLRTAGFEVVEAESADEAIVILKRRLDIKVVFTDVQMSGSMDGLKLAAAIRAAGRLSKSWRHRGCSGSARMTCHLAFAFYPSPTAPCRSLGCSARSPASFEHTRPPRMRSGSSTVSLIGFESKALMAAPLGSV